jgi:alanine-synthesizing transaminase
VLSQRTDHDPTPNALARAVQERRARGERILDLTQSNPTTAGLPYDEQAILAAIGKRDSLVYAPSPFGLRVAREAVAAHLAELGPAIDPDRIVLAASTSEAYSFLLHALCDPGDEILIAAPSYPLVSELATLAGVHVATFPLRFDGSWTVDAEPLFDAVNERTRAVLLASPNHPTGHFLDADTLGALTELDLPIISDEVFARYPLETREGTLRTILGAREVFSIALEGLSKTAALPQLKLGWMALSGADDRVDPLLTRLERIADAFLSVSTPVQHALPELLRSTRITREAITARTRENLALIREALAGSSAVVPRVEGGWFACIRVPETRSDEAWALALLEHGVLVSPGYLFDFPDGAWLVISLLTPTPHLREALPILRTELDRA